MGTRVIFLNILKENIVIAPRRWPIRAVNNFDHWDFPMYNTPLHHRSQIGFFGEQNRPGDGRSNWHERYSTLTFSIRFFSSMRWKFTSDEQLSHRPLFKNSSDYLNRPSVFPFLELLMPTRQSSSWSSSHRTRPNSSGVYHGQAVLKKTKTEGWVRSNWICLTHQIPQASKASKVRAHHSQINENLGHWHKITASHSVLF